MKIVSGPPGFSSLFMTLQNQVDHTFWLHLRKNKQKMKTRWTIHSWNNAIWLALRPCDMTLTRKINKLKKPGRPQGNFHALFARSPTFYGHFWTDIVMSDWSTHISSSISWADNSRICSIKNAKFSGYCFYMKTNIYREIFKFALVYT